MRAPTEKQVEAMLAVARMTSRNGRAPTLHELSKGLGVSLASAHARLVLLAKKGAITRSNLPRSVRLTDEGCRIAATFGVGYIPPPEPSAPLPKMPGALYGESAVYQRVEILPLTP